MAPISDASSGVRSLIWTAVMSPRRPSRPRARRRRGSRSRSRSRSSSATIVPWKSGSTNPSTIIWTGPMVPLVSLIVRSAPSASAASNSAWVRTPESRRPLRLVSSATMSEPPAHGGGRCGRRGRVLGLGVLAWSANCSSGPVRWLEPRLTSCRRGGRRRPPLRLRLLVGAAFCVASSRDSPRIRLALTAGVSTVTLIGTLP